MSEMITLQEAARLAGVHEKTLRRWIAAGSLTGYRMGPRLLRVKRADIERIARPIPTTGDAA